MVGAAKQDRSAQTRFAFAAIDARISSALQTGREAKSYCGCRFLQRRAKKRKALLSLFQATGVAMLPSRNHEADTVALCLAAAVSKRNLPNTTNLIAFRAINAAGNCLKRFKNKQNSHSAHPQHLPFKIKACNLSKKNYWPHWLLSWKL